MSEYVLGTRLYTQKIKGGGKIHTHIHNTKPQVTIPNASCCLNQLGVSWAEKNVVSAIIVLGGKSGSNAPKDSSLC